MDFLEINLTRKERKLLKRSKKNPITISDAPHLLRFGLVYELCHTSPGDMPIRTGKAVISEKGRDYLQYRKAEIRKEIAIPVIVSVAANLGIAGLKWLLPQIQKLLSVFLCQAS